METTRQRLIAKDGWVMVGNHREPKNKESKAPSNTLVTSRLKDPVPPDVQKQFQQSLETLNAQCSQLVATVDQLTGMTKQYPGLFTPFREAVYNLEVLKLARDMAYITKQVLTPPPPPLPDERKDAKAYQALHDKLANIKPLQQLVDQVNGLSSTYAVGKDIGEAPQADPQNVDISTVTLNGGWMPEFLKGLISINGTELREDQLRATEVSQFFKNMCQYVGAPDVICLEESFDAGTRKLFKDEMSKLGYVSFGDKGQKTLNAGSGLLSFTLFPLVDETFEGYHPKRFGDEMLANKGIDVERVLVEKNGVKYVLIVASTHLTSGDGIFNGGYLPSDATLLGTTSELRGREAQKIHNLLVQLENEPIMNPQTGQPFPALGTVLLGDFNKSFPELYTYLNLSTGNSFNQRQQGDVKEEGFFNLFRPFLSNIDKTCWPLPKNFCNVLTPKPARVQGGKPIDPDREKMAEQQNLATGSTLPDPDLEANKAGKKDLTLQTTEHKLIDVTIAKPGSNNQLIKFESYLVQAMNNEQKAKADSDHNMLWAKMQFTPPKAPKLELKQQAQTVPVEQLQPAASDSKAGVSLPLPSLKDKQALTQFGFTEPEPTLVEKPVAQENYLAANFGS